MQHKSIRTVATAAAAISVAVTLTACTGSQPQTGTSPKASTSSPVAAPSTSVPVQPTPAPDKQAPAQAGPEKVPATAQADYAYGNVVHVDGRTVVLAKGTEVQAFSRLAGDRLLVMTTGQRVSTSQIAIHDRTGRVQTVLKKGSVDVRTTFAADPDGSHFILTTGSYTSRYTANGLVATEPVRTPDGVARALTDDLAFVQTGDTTTVWHLEQGTTSTLDDVVTAVSADGDHAAYRRYTGDYTTCWGLLDLTRESRPRTVEHCPTAGTQGAHFVPTQVSNDGRTVLGTDPMDGGFYYGYGAYDARTGRSVLPRALVTRGELMHGWGLSLVGDAYVASRNIGKGDDRVTVLETYSAERGLDRVGAPRMVTEFGQSSRTYTIAGN